MRSPRRCEHCGRELPAHAPEGLCPSCLLRLGAAELGLDLQGPESKVESQEAQAQSSETEAGSQNSAQKPMDSGLCTVVGGQRFGDYQLLEKIGEGGMGVVYKARQLRLDRLVAVKVLPFGQFSRAEVVQRFRAEAAAAASLQHPNIVAIHEVGEHEGQHYFSMDLVTGQTLAELVRDQPLPAKRAAAYVKTIAEAVHYAHQQGILHRDLKPSNVLIDVNDRPRITDFGLAKRLTAKSETELTFTGQVLGSPNFMSPEQAEGAQAIGPATDIYSLGALLYHLLTRQPPFQAETLTTLLKQVLETEPVPPRRLNPSIPRDLETIVLKCLEKEPHRRYTTAQELADELGRFLEDKPIQARPVSLVGKAWKWCRRRPALAAMATALMLTATLGLAGVLWQWHRARQNAQAELRQRERAEGGEYAADMHLAQLAIADNNRALAISLLDKYRPGAGSRISNLKSQIQGDLRGWEWRYLGQLCQGDEHFTLQRYPEGINALAVSTDRNLLAVATGHQVALWDLTTRRFLTMLTNVGGAQLAFVSTNGLLAVASSDAAAQTGVTVWDVSASTVVKRLPQPPGIRSLAASPDGKLLATLDHRGNVTVVDWVSDRTITNLMVPLSRLGGAGLVAFSIDGGRLVIAGECGRTRLLDLPTGATVFLPTQLGASVTELAFSPEGDLLATGYGYGKGTIDLWDARSGAPRGQLTNHTGSVIALAFTPDGGRLASASEDGTLRLWNVTNRTQIASLQSSYEQTWFLSVLPDGETLVSGGSGGSICLWDVTTARRAPVQTSMTVSPGFAHVAEVEAAGYLPGNLDPRVPRRSGFAFTPDSRHFIGLDINGALAFWETYPTRAVEQLTALGSNHWGMALSPDGRWLVTGDDIGALTIWNCPAHQAVTNFALPFEYWGVLRFTRNGHHLITLIVRNDHTVRVRLWRTADWSEVPLTGPQFANLGSVDLSPDERWLAAGYMGGQVKLFRHPSGEPEVTFRSHDEPVFVLFSPKGDFLVSTSMDGSTCLWDLATRRQRASFGGQSGPVFGTTLSPDGWRLATSGTESIKVWDLVAHRELVSLQGKGQFFINPAFSPDGNTLTATAVSGTAHLWHAPSWEEIEAAENRQKPR